ncbi:MAG: DUF87 domain-containing protein [Methanomicrobiaceae archaeon]|nr:DUF87 domain-containing protein [Methanomicrobiaceae archaeon]
MELLIGKAGERDFSIDAQELVTGRTCVIAQSGAGKSWSIAVLCECLCRARIGFCLIDTEGEYFSLRDKFPVLWIGTDEQCDHDIETVNIRDVMLHAVKADMSVVYDVSETDMQERVSKLANVLYDVSSELRKPYLLIIEEADKFIPQSRESIKKIEEISRRGRKRGLGMLVATQRPALVTKNVLSQCNNQIIGKLSIDNDLKAVDLFFGSRKEVEELAFLNPGEFFVMGKLSREKTKIKFADRETEHRGLTPKLAPRSFIPVEEMKPPLPADTPGTVEPREPEPAHEEADLMVHPPEVRQRGDEEGPPIACAVLPFLSRDEALEIAGERRRKKLLGFGTEERIASVEMVYWPLIVAECKFLGGVLTKVTKMKTVIIEGVYGHCAQVRVGLYLSPCFAELVGLDEDAIRVLSHLSSRGHTEAEIEAEAKLPLAAVKRAIKKLKAQKLVTESGSVGKAKMYIPLLMHKIPRLSKIGGSVEAKTGAARGEARDPELEDGDVRTLLKGIEPTAEVTCIETVHYPLYLVDLASDAGDRSFYLDALTGREISFDDIS